MIDLKIFPSCCPTRQYTLLGLIYLSNGAIWEIYECQECEHIVRKFLMWFHKIEEINSETQAQSKSQDEEIGKGKTVTVVSAKVIKNVDDFKKAITKK